MTAEQLNLIVAIGTFVVLSTAAVAALVQLRHIRAQYPDGYHPRGFVRLPNPDVWPKSS